MKNRRSHDSSGGIECTVFNIVYPKAKELLPQVFLDLHSTERFLSIFLLFVALSCIRALARS